MYNEKKIHQRVVERMKQKASGIIIKEKIVDKQNTKIEETRTKEKNPNVPKIKKTMEQMKKIKNEVEKLDEIDNYGYQHRAKKDGQKQFLALLSKEKLTRADKETHGEQKIYDATEQLEKGVIWIDRGNWESGEIKTPKNYVTEMKKIIENYKKTFENLPEKEKQERQGIYERVMENTKAALKGFGLEALKHNMPEIAQDILEYTGLLKNSPLIGKQLEKRIKRNEIKKEQAAKEKRNDELEHAGLLGRGAYRILTGKESKEQVPSYILSTSKEILYYGNDLSFSKNTPPVKTPENYVNAIQTEIQEGKKRLETAANKKYVNEIIEEAIGSLKEFGSEAKKYGDENIYNLVKKVLESEGLN